jgi:hypothetical protein
MRTALAFILMAHGVAHLPGFLVPWRISSPPDLPYQTRLLNGALELGDLGARVVGVLWLLAAIAFGAAAVATYRGAPRWATFALAVVLFSLILSALGWPASRIGLAVNVVLLVVLAAAFRRSGTS